MQKYVWTGVQPGLYKAFIALKLVKVKVNLLPGPTWFLFGIWIVDLKWKICLNPDPIWFLKFSFRHKNLKGASKSAARAYLVPIWHVDRGITMKKYVCTRVLPGLFKAVIEI